MPTTKSTLWLSLAVVCLLGMSLVLPAHAGPGSRDLVISQVYGGGGNGVTYKNDFVELFNAGVLSPSHLTGLRSSMQPDWHRRFRKQCSNMTVLPPSVTFNRASTYLVQEARQAAAGLALPAADSLATSNLDLSGTNGKDRVDEQHNLLWVAMVARYHAPTRTRP